MNNQVETNGATDVVSHIPPRQGWGFRIEGSKQIHLDNDVYINWSHLATKQQGNLPNGTLFAVGASGFYAGLIKFDPTWDAVHIETGQTMWIDFIHSTSSYTGDGIVASSYGNKNSANYNLNGLTLGLKWNSNA